MPREMQVPTGERLLLSKRNELGRSRTHTPTRKDKYLVEDYGFSVTVRERERGCYKSQHHEKGQKTEKSEHFDEHSKWSSINDNEEVITRPRPRRRLGVFSLVISYAVRRWRSYTSCNVQAPRTGLGLRYEWVHRYVPN